ncbi:MAG: FAD-dependent oxidoreductase [Rhodoglobus sp.]
MSFTRRSFLIGAASGVSVLALAACTDSEPVPTPTPRPTSPVDGLPEARAFYRSNWANDPYARGATSFLAVGALPQSRDALREPVLDRLFMAGEALSDAPGTVGGAVASGRSAAQSVVGVMDEGERIAVIGAGAAGAAAARVLAANGVEVIVLEARDRTGGRIDSKVAGDDFSFELGAWRLAEDVDADIIDDLAREEVDVNPLTGGSSYALTDPQATAELDAEDPALSAAHNALGAAIEWAKQQPRDVSLADALTEGGKPNDWPAAGVDGVTSDVLLNQLILNVAGATGADADGLSAWFSTPEAEVSSVVPTGPLSSFIDAALDGVNTVMSAAVVGVSYRESGVSIRLATGESVRADRVVVTVPLGVLQEQVIEFDPPLPLSHRSALNALSVGHIELVVMDFETAFWETDALWWVNENEDGPIRLWVNLLPATGRPVLLGVVAAQNALELAEADDAKVLAMARKSLEPFAQSGT